MQNKPNFLEAQMNATFLPEKDYENELRRRFQKSKPEQTQFQSPTAAPNECKQKSLTVIDDCQARNTTMGRGGIEPPTHGFSVRCSTD